MFGPFVTKTDAPASTPVGSRHGGPGSRGESKPQAATIANQVKHPVIGVLGSKGGVGATTTALNLTAALAAAGKATTLIDANMQQPDAAVLLSTPVKYGLVELLERREELDASVVSACSITISESLPCRLISPPLSGEAGVKIQLSEVADCVASMRACSDFWVIDLPKHLDRHLVTLMDKCDQLVLLVEPTLASVNAAHRWESVFEELGYGRDRIVWVLNRHGGKMKIVERELEKLAAELIRIPNSFEMLEVCVARGETAAAANGRSPYAVAIKRLAQLLMERLA
jgi:pilus assembly protein CpaE